MLLEDILNGESKNIEFKIERSNNSKNYMKTIVAFANGSGGKLIFGIDDEHNIVGMNKENIFNEIDAIANAISDSCTPAIIPDITIQNTDKNSLIVVEVFPGRQRPYYIKSEGMENGTYIRVGSTTRQADYLQIREMMFENAPVCFDKTVCTGLSITDEDISELCKKMKSIAVKHCKTEEEKAEVKDVTKSQLLSWGILTEREGKILPTNAYALLTGASEIPTKVQCGIFKGKTRDVFVDRREFSGSILDELEEAYNYALAKINMGALIDGLVRKDVFEIPPNAIRELVTNAVLHRSYIDNSNIQVALYDDRLEITSPGGLVRGLTVDMIKEGRSKPRNEALTSAFLYMKLIENWGSGIPRVISDIKTYGLREPEMIDSETDFRINIYRGQLQGNIDKATKEVPKKHQKSAEEVPKKCRRSAEDTNFTQQQKTILSYLKNNDFITTAQAQDLLNVKERRARDILHKMVKDKILIKKGATNTARYVLPE